MPISIQIDLHDIESLTWPMWEACSIECPAMIGAPCPAQSGGQYMDGPADAAHYGTRCPGWSAKFTNAAAEVVYGWTLESGQSDECGTTEYGGNSYALFRNPDVGTHDGPMGAGVILVVTGRGAVSAERYATDEGLEKVWAQLQRETRECPYETDGCTHDSLCAQCTDDEEI